MLLLFPAAVLVAERGHLMSRSFCLSSGDWFFGMAKLASPGDVESLCPSFVPWAVANDFSEMEHLSSFFLFKPFFIRSFGISSRLRFSI